MAPRPRAGHTASDTMHRRLPFQRSAWRASLNFNSLQLLTDVAHALAEALRPFGKRFVCDEQVTVGGEHRATAAGVGHDGRLFTQS